MFCKNCGYELDGEQLYCPKCEQATIYAKAYSIFMSETKNDNLESEPTPLRHGAANASLLFGILTIPLVICMGFSEMFMVTSSMYALICSILALALCRLSKKRNSGIKLGTAKAGQVLGILGIICCSIWAAIYIFGIIMISYLG